MAWELEKHQVWEHEGEHRMTLVNHAVRTQSGEPARWTIQLALGGEAFEYQIDKRLIRLQLGGEVAIGDDGKAHLPNGEPFDPLELARKVIAELNQHHDRRRLYARRHGAEIVSGPARG